MVIVSNASIWATERQSPFPGARRSAWAAAAAVCLLAAAGSARAAGDEALFTVRPGDTLIGISTQYLDRPTRWPALKELNRIDDELRLVPGSRLRLPAKWLRWSRGAAEVLHVQGTVTGSAGPLVAGMRLTEGERIDTGADGLLTLRLRDGATVVFPPASRARLGVLREVPGLPLGRTAIELERGGAESRVPSLGRSPSQFEVRTPRVVTAVRGTRFRVAAEGAHSRHEVLDGRVEVTGTATARNARNARVALDPGQGVSSADGRLDKPVALLPAPDTAALPRRIERTVARLTAPAQPGAAAWRWQVAADAEFTRPLKDERSATPAWLLTGLADGDFHLRLRAIDANGLEGRDAVTQLAVRARPEPPLILQPAHDGRVGGVAVLRWTAAADAVGVHLQVARDAAFTDLLVDRPDLDATQFAPAAALPEGEYFWRLSSRRADGYRGPFGDAARFVQLAPTAMAPPELSDDRLRLAWSGPADLDYRLQLAADPEFAAPLHDATVRGNQTTLPAPAAGSYFARTQPLLPGGGTTPWSAPQRFEIPGGAPWWLLLVLLPLL